MDYILFNLFSNIMSAVFPFVWFVVSFLIFGKEIYRFVFRKYTETIFYDVDAEYRISRIAAVATIIFMVVSCFDITGVSNKIAMDLIGNFLPIPIAIQVLAYLLRCLIALIIDIIFCIVAWFFYLRHL